MKDKRSKSKAECELKEIQRNVAGIDIGSREHWACAPRLDGNGYDVECFGSTTAELYRLVAWLKERGIQSVAMESTGVYWIPLYEILESRGFEAVLVNARSLKSVPGRKTDVLDCQWIQKLHSCGLLKGAFRPSDDICALRALVRERGTLISEQADWLRRMQKSFDQMNIRIHHAVADISGTTGMAIIRAIVEGERNPLTLAGMRDQRCHKSVKEIAAYLQGTWRAEHLFNLEQALLIYDFLQRRLEAYDVAILEALTRLSKQELQDASAPALRTATKMKALKKHGLEPMREALYRLSGADLMTIDGIGGETAETVLSELGNDLSDFPTENHFVSYLRLAPKLAISGGKRIRSKRHLSTATRVGSALRMAATTLRHSKTALGAEFRRVARTKGPGVAVFVMARKLAILIFRLLRFGQGYIDIGMEAYEEQYRKRRIAACRELAKSLGLKLVDTVETAA